MKKTWLMIGIAAAATLFTTVAIGNDASVEQGKKLFNDPALGGSTNTSSCNTCHPDGRGLAMEWEDGNLISMINICIKRPLKGQALDTDSAEMNALKLYIKSLK